MLSRVASHQGSLTKPRLARTLFHQLSEYFLMITVVGVLAYCLCVIFQLVTLPTEFDASHRALQCINEYGLLTDDERAGAKKVLTAAAMTYVASLAVALSQLLRLLLIVAGNRRR